MRQSALLLSGQLCQVTHGTEWTLTSGENTLLRLLANLAVVVCVDREREREREGW